VRASVAVGLHQLPLLLAVGALAGCSSNSGAEITGQPIVGDEIRRERQLAWIRFYEDPMLVEVPNVVSRGVDLEVAVRTFGGGCISQGDTEVSISGRSAEVRPFDVFVTHLPPNYACTSELRYYLHRATLRFAERGLATVRVRGRAHPGDRVIVVAKLVIVQ
jgi:hypothetical protein